MKKIIFLTTCLIFFVAIKMTGFAEETEIKASSAASVSVELVSDTTEEKEMTQAEWEEKEKVVASKTLFETKCKKCHSSQRPLSQKKNRDAWKETVLRMQQKDPAWILPAEVTTIVDYLFKINGIEEKVKE